MIRHYDPRLSQYSQSAPSSPIPRTAKEHPTIVRVKENERLRRAWDKFQQRLHPKNELKKLLNDAIRG